MKILLTCVQFIVYFIIVENCLGYVLAIFLDINTKHEHSWCYAFILQVLTCFDECSCRHCDIQLNLVYYLNLIIKGRLLEIAYIAISNAMISPVSRENFCHHTELFPDLEGFNFFTYNFCSVK